MQNAIVLGGGMIGVSAALHLRQRGWAVTLVDRRSRAARPATAMPE